MNVLQCVSCSSEPKGHVSECEGVFTAYCDDCGRFTEFQPEKTEHQLRIETAEAQGREYGFPMILSLVTLMHTQAKQNIAWGEECDTPERRAVYFGRAAEQMDRADAYLRGAMEGVKA